MKTIVIFGATSAIAQAVARKLVAGNRVVLVGRDSEKLGIVQADLQARQATSVDVLQANLGDEQTLREALAQLQEQEERIDIALIAHGTLPDQQACETDPAALKDALFVNGLSAVYIMAALAPVMRKQGAGTLAVISSVAGDRGRQSNYAYGSAKAMVTTYASGLRNALQPFGVNVLTIKPGFVDTPMTAAFDKGALWAQPEDVADDIVRAINRGRGEIYTPWFWRYIMLVIKSIPEVIFRRLKL